MMAAINRGNPDMRQDQEETARQSVHAATRIKQNLPQKCGGLAAMPADATSTGKTPRCDVRENSTASTPQSKIEVDVNIVASRFNRCWLE
jgi:hypothetical protein